MQTAYKSSNNSKCLKVFAYDTCKIKFYAQLLEILKSSIRGVAISSEE